MICEKCGTFIPSDATACVNCGEPATATQEAPTLEQPVQTFDAPVFPEEKKENFITGIVGAFIGAVIGGASIVLLSQLGYVAALSGLILAVCTLKGYELLGKKLSVKGLIICLALILITPYIADRIDWAIVIMQNSLGSTLGEAFANVPLYIEVGAIEKSNYITSLLMVYGFAALGAFSALRDLFKKR